MTRATLAAVRARLARLSALALAVLLGACRLGPAPLATVGHRSITMEGLSDVVAAQTGRDPKEAPPELFAALFESTLEEEVILQAGGEDTEPSVAAASRGARVRALLATLCPPPPEPTEAQIDAYIAEHSELVQQSEQLRLRQLILPDLSTAKAARDRVRQGEDFELLSRQLSRAPNAASGGMLGWVESGQLPPKFEAAVLSLRVGEVSEPVESNAGWHVFQVIDRRSGTTASDPEVRARVHTELAAVAAEASRQACLLRLAGQVGVTVNCRNAPFPCRNPFEGQP
jgi:peptidyl-prolyl cis-trans isomerase C